ncbi:DUF881 domain-containing protein [Nocardioides sp.]|uniref:DUF881 domain-containing protein n=1 Tax=Nocardioides sp. TaxID=35761 RepID=UPI0019A875C3|nr:DUF881 domain-containing protein [Nocardioides sp.]MBC7275727.1 DUF881 domain-containing protein [Nocardioides sp.]
MPDRKRRPAVKRTAAKRTPAKKTAAKKPAVPAEEAVNEDVAAPEDEGTPPAEPDPSGEPAEATDDAEGASEETAESEAAKAEPDEPAVESTDESTDETDAVEEPAAAEQPAVDSARDEVEPDETDESVETVETVDPDEAAEAEEPAAEKADEPADPDTREDEDVPNDSDEPDESDESDESDEPDESGEVAEVAEPEEPEKTEEPAATEEPEEEPTPLVGRARLFDALTHFRRGQVAVAVLLCILGYAAVVQVQTNTEDSTYAGLREQELIDILSGLAGTTQKAQEQIEELEATRDELEDQTLQQQTALQRAEEQVDTLRVIAGTVPVSGPGITIEIDPGSDPLRLTALLDLIEELRTSGAEAMEIEGADGEAVRLVASSSIEVNQPTPGLDVGGEMISPPYRLQVIGPPDTLAGAIDFYQGPQDQLEEQGAEVEVESEEKIDIESIHTVSR